MTDTHTIRSLWPNDSASQHSCNLTIRDVAYNLVFYTSLINGTVEEREQAEEARHLLQCLYTVQHIRLMELAFIHGLDTRQIAKTMHISAQAVAQLRKEALLRLQEYLTN